MSPDVRELLALHLVPGLGPRLTTALLERFGSACRSQPQMAGMVEVLFDRLLPRGRQNEGGSERLQALLELCTRMTRSLDVDRLLGLVVESLFELFGQADRGFVVLEDERTGTFEPRLVRTRRPGAVSEAALSTRPDSSSSAIA